MTTKQTLLLIILALGMAGIALALGNWSAAINPDGIAPHTPTDGDTLAETSPVQNAFLFGISMGLLGTSLLYGSIAFGLFIQSWSRQQPISKFIFALAGLAAMGFVLSYVVDDYFY